MTMTNPWLAPLILSFVSALNVSLWTLRVTRAARNRRVPASTVAAAEAVLFTFAFSHVSQNLGSPSRVVSYAAGVAAGTYLGIVIDQRLSAVRFSRPEPRLPPDGRRAGNGMSDGLIRVRTAHHRTPDGTHYPPDLGSPLFRAPRTFDGRVSVVADPGVSRDAKLPLAGARPTGNPLIP